MKDVKSLSGAKVGTAQVDDTGLTGRMHPVVLREAVLMYEANRRVGTASCKSRNQVHGSGRKVGRQKGGGRARHGNKKAPQFRGGGVAHGPKPRDYSYAMPRKALRRALQVALAGKLRDDEVLRWVGDAVAQPSTKNVRLALASLGALDSALIVAPGAADPALVLSVRNLPRVRVLPAAEVCAYDLVYHQWVVFLDGAYEALTSRLEGLIAAPAAEGSAS